MENNSKKIIHKGISASSGKFYGKCLKILSGEHLILQIHISEDEVHHEIEKFENTIYLTKQELESTIQKFSKELKKELVEILSSQILMLEDPIFLQNVKERIQKKLENAPLAVHNTIEEIAERLSSLGDGYLSERAVDIRDIGERIEANLVGKRSDYTFLENLKEEVILVAHVLTPSQIIHLDKNKVKAIATDTGGKTGHMAILAKNYNIPAVVGLIDITEKISEDEYIFIDADEGIIIQNPSLNEIKLFGASSKTDFGDSKFKPKKIAETRDGTRILVKANLESESDCDLALKYGADGIGLYRSESLFLEHPSNNPTEDEQFHAYKKIVEGMKNKPVIIRTFDLGADKFENEKEENPFLGKRGIRYCLQNKNWFKKQLRAILRASVYGELSLMLPMVTSIQEIIETKELLKESKDLLKSANVPYKRVKIGIMVETPAVAISPDVFTKECDFFSIGTNDLLQYTVAVDRNNSVISDLYNPYHISFFRLLVNTIQIAKKQNIPVGICGEIASDTNFTILLIGLGLREFSVSLPLVPKVKKIIQVIEISQAKKLAKEIMKLSEEEKYLEIESYLFNKHLLNNLV
ncbi:MAG: phosphoenolpyruvate--protein phosphotransferase [Leptospiraceae bacterium]|nr:phosphoenolpyruvate--protein phosphotransferase [Leptospiraceae bacterium]MCK6380921.1 phosphoenolpyruvate--protein phosphotransferase [Leptospiraceae bacterium]NUM40023.1 phosphoenolpyruvate--protein phosphotransferase [Leptospiraceae bacterium]